jgi:DNA-binding HxlR family transcriptional regulator
VKKGMGQHQREKIRQAQIQIILALADPEIRWMQYKELKNSLAMSTATLSKHLKQLNHWINRREETESEEYPHPVRYRLNKKGSSLAKFAKQVGHDTHESLLQLDKVKNETEYLSIINEFNFDQLKKISRFVKDEKNLELHEINFITRLYTEQIGLLTRILCKTLASAILDEDKI